MIADKHYAFDIETATATLFFSVLAHEVHPAHAKTASWL